MIILEEIYVAIKEDTDKLETDIVLDGANTPFVEVTKTRLVETGTS